MALQILISATLGLVSSIGGLYFTYVTAGYLLYGGMYAIMPSLISSMYGKSIGTSVYGITFSGFTIACFI